MSLVEQAIADIKFITQHEWSVTVTFTNPDETETCTVQALSTKSNLSIDPATGLPVNSKNIHISVTESALNDEGYTTRDSEDRISLRKHTVSWADASGTTYDYVVDEQMPSEGTGLIVCILGAK